MARFVILALFAAIIISDAQTKPQIDETQDKLLSSSMRSILSTAKNFAVKAADNVVKVITKNFKDALDASQKVSQFLVENLKRFAYLIGSFVGFSVGGPAGILGRASTGVAIAHYNLTD